MSNTKYFNPRVNIRQHINNAREGLTTRSSFFVQSKKYHRVRRHIAKPLHACVQINLSLCLLKNEYTPYLLNQELLSSSSRLNLAQQLYWISKP